MQQQRDTYGASQLNMGQRRFWCEDLGFGDIVQMIDAEGHDTDDPSAASQVIVEFNAACWLNVRVADYTPEPRH